LRRPDSGCSAAASAPGIETIAPTPVARLPIAAPISPTVAIDSNRLSRFVARGVDLLLKLPDLRREHGALRVGDLDPALRAHHVELRLGHPVGELPEHEAELIVRGVGDLGLRRGFLHVQELRQHELGLAEQPLGDVPEGRRDVELPRDPARGLLQDQALAQRRRARVGGIELECGVELRQRPQLALRVEDAVVVLADVGAVARPRGEHLAVDGLEDVLARDLRDAHRSRGSAGPLRALLARLPRRPALATVPARSAKAALAAGAGRDGRARRRPVADRDRAAVPALAAGLAVLAVAARSQHRLVGPELHAVVAVRARIAVHPRHAGHRDTQRAGDRTRPDDDRGRRIARRGHADRRLPGDELVGEDDVVEVLAQARERAARGRQHERVAGPRCDARTGEPGEQRVIDGQAVPDEAQGWHRIGLPVEVGPATRAGRLGDRPIVLAPARRRAYGYRGPGVSDWTGPLGSGGICTAISWPSTNPADRRRSSPLQNRPGSYQFGPRWLGSSSMAW